MTDIYRQLILDHYHQPRNFGRLVNPNASVKVNNPLCGDSLQLELEIKHNRIKDIGFTGQGCAISIASASIVTEYLKGKSLDDIKQLTADKLLKLLKIDLSPIRIKCALLIWQAVKQALAGYQSQTGADPA